jgi:RNA polymerase subunit RPABC4/transcription elongation factor Spt4
MTLIACAECGKPVSDGAEKCPQCGAPVVSLKRSAATAWRHGLSHAWKAAAAFPVLFVLIQLLRGGGPRNIFTIDQLPWIGLIAVWGWIASMTAIGISAVLRRLFKGSRNEDLWAWSDAAVATVILFFGLWLTTIPLNPM